MGRICTESGDTDRIGMIAVHHVDRIHNFELKEIIDLEFVISGLRIAGKSSEHYG